MRLVDTLQAHGQPFRAIISIDARHFDSNALCIQDIVRRQVRRLRPVRRIPLPRHMQASVLLLLYDEAEVCMCIHTSPLRLRVPLGAHPTPKKGNQVPAERSQSSRRIKQPSGSFQGTGSPWLTGVPWSTRHRRRPPMHCRKKDMAKRQKLGATCPLLRRCVSSNRARRPIGDSTALYAGVAPMPRLTLGFNTTRAASFAISRSMEKQYIVAASRTQLAA